MNQHEYYSNASDAHVESFNTPNGKLEIPPDTPAILTLGYKIREEATLENITEDARFQNEEQFMQQIAMFQKETDNGERQLVLHDIDFPEKSISIPIDGSENLRLVKLGRNAGNELAADSTQNMVSRSHMNLIISGDGGVTLMHNERPGANGTTIHTGDKAVTYLENLHPAAVEADYKLAEHNGETHSPEYQAHIQYIHHELGKAAERALVVDELPSATDQELAGIDSKSATLREVLHEEGETTPVTVDNKEVTDDSHESLEIEVPANTQSNISPQNNLNDEQHIITPDTTPKETVDTPAVEDSFAAEKNDIAVHEKHVLHEVNAESRDFSFKKLDTFLGGENETILSLFKEQVAQSSNMPTGTVEELYTALQSETGRAAAKHFFKNELARMQLDDEQLPPESRELPQRFWPESEGNLKQHALTGEHETSIDYAAGLSVDMLSGRYDITRQGADLTSIEKDQEAVHDGQHRYAALLVLRKVSEKEQVAEQPQQFVDVLNTDEGQVNLLRNQQGEVSHMLTVTNQHINQLRQLLVEQSPMYLNNTLNECQSYINSYHTYGMSVMEQIGSGVTQLEQRGDIETDEIRHAIVITLQQLDEYTQKARTKIAQFVESIQSEQHTPDNYHAQANYVMDGIQYDLQQLNGAAARLQQSLEQATQNKKQA